MELDFDVNCSSGHTVWPFENCFDKLLYFSITYPKLINLPLWERLQKCVTDRRTDRRTDHIKCKAVTQCHRRCNQNIICFDMFWLFNDFILIIKWKLYFLSDAMARLYNTTIIQGGNRKLMSWARFQMATPSWLVFRQ